jgi:hypothetical protein
MAWKRALLDNLPHGRCRAGFSPASIGEDVRRLPHRPTTPVRKEALKSAEFDDTAPGTRRTAIRADLSMTDGLDIRHPRPRMGKPSTRTVEQLPAPSSAAP